MCLRQQIFIYYVARNQKDKWLRTRQSLILLFREGHLLNVFSSFPKQEINWDLWCCFYKNHIHVAWTNYLPEPPILNTVIFGGLCFNICILVGHKCLGVGQKHYAHKKVAAKFFIRSVYNSSVPKIFEKLSSLLHRYVQ